MKIIASFNEVRQISEEGHSNSKRQANIFDDSTEIKKIIEWYNSFSYGSKDNLIITIQGIDK